MKGSEARNQFLPCIFKMFVCSVVSDSFNPTDCSLPGSSVHGIFQARMLEWVVIYFSRESSQPRDWTHLLCYRLILYHWAVIEAHHRFKGSLLNLENFFFQWTFFWTPFVFKIDHLVVRKWPSLFLIIFLALNSTLVLISCFCFFFFFINVSMIHLLLFTFNVSRLFIYSVRTW